MHIRGKHPGGLAIAAGLVVATALAGDWRNSGGNAQRNGLTDELGPDAPAILWSGSRTSLIAWPPMIEGRRVFTVRQSGWPGSEPGKSPVVCHDLDTGQELWAAHVPFFPGDWTTWILGVNEGRVYASRSGNGSTVAAKVYGLDVTTGGLVWESVQEITATPYDGVVFAPNGDLLIGSFTTLTRIRAADGTTAWEVPRLCSVSSSCGCAASEDTVYIADAAPGGHALKAYDMETGAFLYQTDVMPGFTLQTVPFLTPDGGVCLPRTQNNATVDYFYLWDDKGDGFDLRWSVPCGWTTFGDFGAAADGSPFMVAPGNIIQRLDPDTGVPVESSPALPGFTAPHAAVDARGWLYVGNGSFQTGRLYAFDETLTERWSVPVTNINIGGPALGTDGTLVVCGVGTDMRAYRTPHVLVGDVNCDGVVDFGDINVFVLALTDPGTYAALYPTCPLGNRDINGDGSFDFGDINPFVQVLTGG